MLIVDRRAFLALASGGVAAAGLLEPSPAWAGPKPNQTAPGVAAVDTNGRAVDLAGLKGKTVVLEWTNHQCPYVGKHYDSGNMQALQRDAAAAGAVWISIISSGPGRSGHVDAAQANAIAARAGATPNHILLDADGAIGKRYHARSTPTLFVIAPSGAIAFMGGIDDKASTDMADIPQARNYVREALAALSKGRSPAVQSARPYGCTIRYAS